MLRRLRSSKQDMKIYRSCFFYGGGGTIIRDFEPEFIKISKCNQIESPPFSTKSSALGRVGMIVFHKAFM